MTNLAKETGISRQNIYQMFSENDNPTIRNLELLLKAMGYRLSVKAVGKGLVRGWFWLMILFVQETLAQII